MAGQPGEQADTRGDGDHRNAHPGDRQREVIEQRAGGGYECARQPGFEVVAALAGRAEDERGDEDADVSEYRTENRDEPPEKDADGHERERDEKCPWRENPLNALARRRSVARRRPLGFATRVVGRGPFDLREQLVGVAGRRPFAGAVGHSETSVPSSMDLSPPAGRVSRQSPSAVNSSTSGIDSFAAVICCMRWPCLLVAYSTSSPV